MMLRIESPVTAVRPESAATLEEAEAFLAAHPEIEAFDLLLVDPNGILRGKIIRRHELLAVYKNGRNLPGSILGLDVAGEDVEATGLVWEDGDADRCAWPVPGSLAIAPPGVTTRGQFIVSLFELDGRPVGADPRAVLQTAVERLQAMGYEPVAAFELEFYLLDGSSDINGAPKPARLPLTGAAPSGVNVYGVDDLVRMQPFSAELYRTAAAQGLPVETMISEYAPGQFELTLRHRPILQAATDLILLKRLIRCLAERHQMKACFMAKPFGDRAGSGMHLHVSLADSQGENLFADQDGALAPLMLHAIGGLLDTLGDAMLAFAPNNNSWRRFSAQSYAPTVPNWGVNNRGVAIRVPAGAPKGRHLEQRMAGVDANPFIVAAVTLAGIAHGLQHAIDPGAPADGDGTGEIGGKPLPSSWKDAILRAEASPFMREALGPGMHRAFTAIKRAEAARFDAYVSPLDYQLYLDTI